MDAKLTIISPDVQPKEFKLSLPTTIGRSRQASIKLAHALVSRIHCELFEANGVLMVRDLGSLNGTFVGSQQVSEGPISPGETLTVGTVTFQAQYDQAADPKAKTKTIGTTMAVKAGAAAGVGANSQQPASLPAAMQTPPPEGEMESLDELWELDDDDTQTKRKKATATDNQKTVNAKPAAPPPKGAAPKGAAPPPEAKQPAPPAKPAAAADDDDDVLEWLKDEEE